MTRRDLLMIGTWAAAAFGLTLAVTLPSRLEAVDASANAKIAIPTLTANGCQLSVRCADAQTLKAGDQPVLDLVATNTTDASVEFKCNVTMAASQPPSCASRVMPMPRSIWKMEQTIALAPHESRTIKVETRTPLPNGTSISITLGVDKQQIVAARFGVGSIAGKMTQVQAAGSQLTRKVTQ